MPSIYNHENACWGIRRSSCDVFQYDFNEEFKANKLREFGCPAAQNNATPNNTYVNYSVSSNGYYGYQPHKVTQIESSNETEMDVEDTNTSETSSIAPNSMLVCAPFNSDLPNHNARRKRQMACESQEGSKRIRQDEPEGLTPSPIQEHRQCGGGSSLRSRRLRHNTLELSDGDYESTTVQLLRQTHGCELYLFERTCDY